MKFLFSSGFWRILAFLGLFFSIAGLADPIYLACVDCYGTASFYPRESRKLFPDQDIRWIHIQTEKDVQSSYRRSFEATQDQYEIRVTCDPEDNESLERTLNLLREKKITRAVGGLETGTVWADLMNRRLGLPGNNPETSHLRREKKPMQEALGDLSIPTFEIHRNNKAEALAFLQSLKSKNVVLKPNASSGGEFVTFARRNRPEDIWKKAESLFGKTDKYGNKLDSILLQPAIRGPQYAANTSARNGHVVLTALYRYWKFFIDETHEVYMLDLPVDLASPIAQEIRSVVGDVHHRLDNLNGIGHNEFVYDIDAKRLRCFEQGARVGGSGMSMIDEQVWGTSHLHLHLLSILAPDRYDAEVATFPRRKLQEAATVDLISLFPGLYRASSRDFIRQLDTYFTPASYFESEDGVRMDKTIDMKTSPDTLNLLGTREKVVQDIHKLINAQLDGTLFEYDKPQGITDTCRFHFQRLSHAVRLKRKISQVQWE